MPIDPETNKASRIRMAIEDGRRVRHTVHSGASLDAAVKATKAKSKKGADDAPEKSED